jgi:o-succinylbenzoate synthase
MPPLTIDRVDLLIVEMSLVRSFTTSEARRTTLRHIIVKAYADGLVGWGESATPVDPYYCEETTETGWHILEQFLVPSVLGKPFASAAELRACYAKVKRHNFAKAGLEMAAWDLLAKAQNLPLHALVGGTRSEVLSGVSLGIEPRIDDLFRNIDQYLDEGYRRIKLKIAPGRDVDYVRQVRERYPDVPLMADANSAYRLSDLPTLQQLDAFDLMMIEQPLAHDDIVDHARLQAGLKTAVCLDESIHSAEDARKALELGSGRIINIKVSRVGGLDEARRIHDLCQARGVPVWCGGMHEYGIGRAANVAISTLPGFTLPGDVSGSDKYYAEDIVDPPILATRGAITPPDGPGLGWEPNETRLSRLTVRQQTLSTIAQGRP